MGRNKARVRQRSHNTGGMFAHMQHDASRLRTGIAKIGRLPADPPPLRRATPVSGTIAFYLTQWDGYQSELPPISQQFGLGSFHEPGYIVVKPTESGTVFHKDLNAGIIEGMIMAQLLGIDITCIKTAGFRFMIHKISVWGAVSTSDVGLTIDDYLTGFSSAPTACFDNAAKTRWPRVSWTNPRPRWLTTAPEVLDKLGTVLIHMPAYDFNQTVWNPTQPPDETKILVRISVTCTTSEASYTSSCPPGQRPSFVGDSGENALDADFTSFKVSDGFRRLLSIGRALYVSK